MPDDQEYVYRFALVLGSKTHKDIRTLLYAMEAYPEVVMTETRFQLFRDGLETQGIILSRIDRRPDVEMEEVE